ncbi:MAG: twin-arginine translocase subunit TatC [bacterium]|nr:twin-arginine translocase subunit TatC [bacterium]
MSDIQPKEPRISSEMSFLGHLEELRSRLFKGAIGLVIGCIVAGIYREWIMNEVLLRPAIRASMNLQNTEPFGQAFLIFKVVFFSGLVLSAPWLLYQIWSFVAPGLYSHERRWARWVTLLTSICFLGGLTFSYFLLIPGMINYIGVVANPNIKDNITVSYYFSFYINTLLACGFVFEMPMVTWVLAKMGMVSAAVMSKYRRHAVVVILILAAIITPSPDFILQVMVAAPIYLLFEVSVVIARLAYKKRDE